MHDRSHPRESTPLLFTEAMYIAAIYSCGGRAEGDKKNTVKYTGSPANGFTCPRTRPFDNVALYIANNRRRARRKLCSPPPLRMVIWVTHPSVTHFALRVAAAHTRVCASYLNISQWRWNESPWMARYRSVDSKVTHLKLSNSLSNFSVEHF